MKKRILAVVLANHTLVTYSVLMIGFFIKKAFFDGWDNLISMAIFNLMYIALLMVLLYSFSVVPAAFIFAVIAVVLLVFALLMGGTASVTHNWSCYKGESWSAFRQGFVRNIRHSLLFFLLIFLFAANIMLIIPFYLQNFGNGFGMIVSIILCWLEIALALVLPFYFPLMNLLPADRPLKTLKKCFIILFDNIGFSLFFFLYDLICFVLSIVTIGLVPGMSGLQLLAQDGMKLIMMKYDWLEENPDGDRKHIPWEDILYDEKGKVGPRSFKNMIFPWK